MPDHASRGRRVVDGRREVLTELAQHDGVHAHPGKACFRLWRPENSVHGSARSIRDANHLSMIVNPQSSAEGTTRERTEIGHHPALKQKSMHGSACGARLADHRTAVVDSESCTISATGERTEIGHYPVAKQKGVQGPVRGARLADHLAEVVDPESFAISATGERAEV
nr:hypothetical protein [Burkholderia sp. LMG 13014]